MCTVKLPDFLQLTQGIDVWEVQRGAAGRFGAVCGVRRDRESGPCSRCFVRVAQSNRGQRCQWVPDPLCVCPGAQSWHALPALLSFTTDLERQPRDLTAVLPLSACALNTAWSNSQKAFWFPQTGPWDDCWPTVFPLRREGEGSRGAFSLQGTFFQHSRWDFVLQQSNLRSCFQSGTGGEDRKG